MKKTNHSLDNLIEMLEELNSDSSHMQSRDDICTPMKCVETMIEYLPEELWSRTKIRVLDPCAGNGNFGAYVMKKTAKENIWFNEINDDRIRNLKRIINPTNLLTEDALILDFKDDKKFDLVMANPPYSGAGNKNKSISNLFIEKSIDLLKDGGYLCFVTPNNWMSFNNNNTTLKRLLNEGSFLVMDNDVKKFFPGVGSSFVVFVWQKAVFNNLTTVKNNYLIKDEQKVLIPKELPFIPLYISNGILSIIQKSILNSNEKIKYRCDLHNFTKKNMLSDKKDEIFQYETIHTARKTRYASLKQEIFDKYLVLIPLSTYFVPFIKTKVNVTQSISYCEFKDKNSALSFLEKITSSDYAYIKLLVHLTRYGNFNNIKLLKNISLDKPKFSKNENLEIEKLIKKIKY